MSVWKHRRAPVAAAIAIVSCSWFWSSPPAAAQACLGDRRPLVVLADPGDAELVRRIGGNIVTVESLFPSEPTFDAADYEACNARAATVREFTVYIANARAFCPRERLWRERLSCANPDGQVCFVGSRQLTSEHDCQHAARRATEIHRVLVSALPRYRELFDANLTAELARLQRLRREPVQFVSSDSLRFTAFKKENIVP